MTRPAVMSSLARSGRVARIGADGRAEVVLDDWPACARCAKGRGCGIAILSPGDQVAIPCRVSPELSSDRLDVGTGVQVAFPESDGHWLWPFALACALPTLGLVAGTLGGGAFGGMAGLAGGLLAWGCLSARLERWLARRSCIDQAAIIQVHTLHEYVT